MAKFIDLTEIYGNTLVNNQSLVHGKIYNDDLLYVSFSQEGDYGNRIINIHVRRFDGNKTTSGVPIIEWWFSNSGSDASNYQEPISLQGPGTVNIYMTSGHMLSPTTGANVPSTTDLKTSIVHSGSHDVVMTITGGDLMQYLTAFINVQVQDIVYSELFDYEN